MYYNESEILTVCPLNAGVALQQHLPSAIHSAQVHGTSVHVSCRNKKLCSPGKGEKSRSAASCPLGRDAMRRPGLCMEWSEWESFLPPAQLLLWQKGRDRALWMSPGHRQLPTSPSDGRAVLQQPLCQGLPWAAQGSAFKHPTKTSAKRCLEEISLQKECIFASMAGVLRGS